MEREALCFFCRIQATGIDAFLCFFILTDCFYYAFYRDPSVEENGAEIRRRG